MKKETRKLRGRSYWKRVRDINRIYDSHARDGLSNREIWRRYIYPVYAISERTLYSILKAGCDEEGAQEETQEEDGRRDGADSPQDIG